jgi:hypothetical protein
MTTVAHCPNCKQTLPASSFHKNRNNKNGLARLCKICINAYNRSWEAGLTEAELKERRTRPPRPFAPVIERRNQVYRKYKMSLEDYDSMLASQGGVCKICKQAEITPTKSGGIRRLCVDHDHSCCPGKFTCGRCVRGLLCSRCNKGLGNFRDDTVMLEQAIAYLQTSAQMIAA